MHCKHLRRVVRSWKTRNRCFCFFNQYFSITEEKALNQNNAAQKGANVRKTVPKSRLLSLSTFELILWTASVLVTSAAFFIFDRRSWMNLAVSITGVTSLAFCSKGNPAGQVLIIALSLIHISEPTRH